MTETETRNNGEGNDGKKDAQRPEWTEAHTWWHVGALAVLGTIMGLAYIAKNRFDGTKGIEFFTTSLIAFLALVTIVAQAVVNIKQLGNMKSALKQNRELFDLAERPSVAVEKVEIVLNENEKASAKILVRNYGKSPAKEVTVSSFLVAGTLKESTEDFPCPDLNLVNKLDDESKLVSRAVIASGGIRYSHAYTRDVMAPSDIANIKGPAEKRTLWLFLLVLINYRGTSGVEYFAKYYSRYNHGRGFEECQTHNDAN